MTMRITRITPQLRTTDLAASIRFYTEMLGFEVAFTVEDFYAGLRAGTQGVHLKLADEADPSIPFVAAEEHFHLYLEVEDITAASAQLRSKGVALVRDVHETEWGTRELILRDNAGHTIYLGQPR